MGVIMPAKIIIFQNSQLRFVKSCFNQYSSYCNKFFTLMANFGTCIHHLGSILTSFKLTQILSPESTKKTWTWGCKFFISVSSDLRLSSSKEGLPGFLSTIIPTKYGKDRIFENHKSKKTFSNLSMQ